MKSMRCAFLLAGLLLTTMAAQTPDVYAPLRLYDGGWIATSSAQPGAPSTDHILNQCRRIGKFFACQQTVNGKVGSLIVFIPTGVAGHYHTQSVTAEGRASGRGDLTIVGPDWTYSSRGEEGGKPMWYRTTNHFRDSTHIHYESASSSDGKTWKVDASGDEAHTR